MSVRGSFIAKIGIAYESLMKCTNVAVDLLSLNNLEFSQLQCQVTRQSTTLTDRGLLDL